MNWRNWLIAILGIGIFILFYLVCAVNKRLAQKDIATSAALDTAHFYKTKLGNQGAYIATIEGNKKDLINLLSLKARENGQYKDVIDSLKKGATSVNHVTTETKIQYVKDIDTVYKSVNISDTVNTKWWDARVNIKNSKLSVGVDIRDELNLTSKKIDNKGIFTGSTLTTFATSKNPDTKITGITSVSTVIDKRKVRISPVVGLGLVSDFKTIKPGAFGGIAISF